MTQRPNSSGEQFSTSTTGSGFETVDLGGSGTTPGATYGSSYNQPSGSTTQGITGQARDKASQVVDQAQQTTSQVVDQARGVATSRVASQKDRTAESLGSVAQALRQTGQQLREQDQAGVTDYVESAANQIERISGYLQNRDVGELIDDVEYLARRQPALFLGGAFVLGLIGARFLKSSSRSRGTSGNYPLATRDTYARTQSYGGGYQGSRNTYGSTGYSATGTSGYGSGGTTAVPTGSGYGTGNLGSTGGAGTTGYGTTGATPANTGTTGYGTTGMGSGTGTTGYGSTGTGSGTGTTEYGSTGTTTGGTGTTGNIDDASGTRSVGGMEER